MKKFFLAIIFLLFATECFAWIDINSDFYEYNFRPRLDILGENIMRLAERIITYQKPTLEVKLTHEERYFPEDSIELYDVKLPFYSSVAWRAIWFDGKTLIEGWAKDDKKFHVNFIRTVDTQIIFRNNIAVGANTSSLVSFFNSRLDEISLEYGIIGHWCVTYGTDNWDVMTSLIVCIEYNNNIITSIEAREDNVYGEDFPFIPSSSRIDDFMNAKKEELDYLSKNQGYLKAIQSGTIRNADVNHYTTSDIILWSLMGGFIVSVFLCVFLKIFVFDDKPNNKPAVTNKPLSESEPEIIDAVFVEDNEKRDTITTEQTTKFTFWSSVTLIEKIVIGITLVSATLALLMLAGFIKPLEYASIHQIRETVTSSFGVFCAWFSVRYSFHLAKRVQDKGTATLIKCVGIFICLFIFWARGYGLF